MSREYEPLGYGFEHTSQDISLRSIPSVSGYDSVSQITEYEDGFQIDSTASLDPNAGAVDPLATVSALPKHIPYSSAPSLVAQEAPRRSQSTGTRPSNGAEQQQFQETDPSPKHLATLVSKYYQNWWFWELAGAIRSIHHHFHACNGAIRSAGRLLQAGKCATTWCQLDYFYCKGVRHR